MNPTPRKELPPLLWARTTDSIKPIVLKAPSVNTAGSAVSKEFVEYLAAHELHELVLKPTRQKSFLDLAFCNAPNLVRNIVVGSPIGNTDHARVEFRLNLHKVRPNITTSMDFTTADDLVIWAYLDSIDWLGSFSSLKSVDVVHCHFTPRHRSTRTCG